jgi:hypothetical protein
MKNDANTTLVNAKSWMINYKKGLPEGVNLMAVCQGKDMTELITTYQTLVDLGYTHIAFNHSSIAYQQEYTGMDSLKAAMYGRMEFIRKLVASGAIRKDVYHHLLGCSLPQEFMYYEGYDFLKSVDTSNPILIGANKETYGDFGSMLTKPKDKMEKFFEQDMLPSMNFITENVREFRKIIEKK